jgi:trans-aconitate methyltransferase
MPSSRAEAAAVVALLRHAGVAEQGIIYELGCGWGSLVIALARAFPQARIRGVEMSPLPYWIARLRTRKWSNVQLRLGNFHGCDLRDAHAVTCYLMINPMRPLAAFLDRMLKPGTPVVSLAFRFRDRQMTVSGELGDAALYYWPARKEES